MNSILLVVSLALFVNVSFAAEACGPRGKSCVSSAACENGACVCKAPNSVGDGAFACYNPTTLAAQVMNDPMLTNFNNESIEFPFPCRYLTTHVLNELKDDNNNVIGTCEFMVHSFNAKNRGKFYLHGFDVALLMKYKAGTVVKMSSRHYGVAKFGSYKFKTRGTMGQFYQNGPWGKDKVSYKDKLNGVQIKVKKDKDNNQLVYQAEKCGFRITFVPYDVKDRRAQVSIPGMAVAVDSAHQPRWLSKDDVMALPPVSQGGATFLDKKIRPLNVEESIFVRAFKNEYVQNMPMKDKGKCDATHKAFGKCTRTEVRKAMKNCFWMLKQPRFIFCMDKSSSSRNILRLFSSCIKLWCSRSGKCNTVQDMITKAGCDTVRDVPELPGFMSGEMCPV